MAKDSSFYRVPQPQTVPGRRRPALTTYYQLGAPFNFTSGRTDTSAASARQRPKSRGPAADNGAVRRRIRHRYPPRALSRDVGAAPAPAPAIRRRTGG